MEAIIKRLKKRRILLTSVDRGSVFLGVTQGPVIGGRDVFHILCQVSHFGHVVVPPSYHNGVPYDLQGGPHMLWATPPAMFVEGFDDLDEGSDLVIPTGTLAVILHYHVHQGHHQVKGRVRGYILDISVCRGLTVQVV